MGRIFLFTIIMGMLGACASISPEQCLAGNWQELGYQDGAKGASADKVNKYTQVCAEHGVSVQQELYSTGYDQGIQSYCTDDRGYRSGESGSSFNQACTGFSYYEAAYVEGRVIYDINREYAYLLDEYEGLGYKFYELEEKLKSPNLSDVEVKTLRRTKIRIQRNLRLLRTDIRDFEIQHKFARADLPRF